MTRTPNNESESRREALERRPLSHLPQAVDLLLLRDAPAQRSPLTPDMTVAPCAYDAEATDKAADAVRELIDRIKVATREELTALTADAQTVKQRAWLAKNKPALADDVDAAVAAALEILDADGGERMET